MKPSRAVRSWGHGLTSRAAAIAPLPGWLLVGLVYLSALVVSHQRLRQYGPDTRFYLAWAYRYGGLSERDAGRRTYEFLNRFSWFKPFCYGGCDTTNPSVTYDWLFHGFSGGLVAPRILYPLLSAPFVRLFGPPGMIVVSVISYAVCILLVMVLANRLLGRWWAVLAGVAVILPIGVARWSTYAYTEALTMALCMACVVVLPLGRRARRHDQVLFGTFLLLFAFTRQFQLILLTGVGLVWLARVTARRQLRNEWLPFLAIAFGVSAVAGIIQRLMAPNYSLLDWFYTHSGASGLSELPAGLLRVAWRVVKAEVWNLTTDLPLIVICLTAAIGLVYHLRSELSQLTIGIAAGTFALNLLNTEPSNFRYYATVFPLFAVVAVYTVATWVGTSASPTVAEVVPDAIPQPREPSRI